MNQKGGIKTIAVSLAVGVIMLLASAHIARGQWSTTSGNTTTTDKVGIGTTGPGASLEINSGSTNQNAIFNATASSGTYQTWRSSGTDKGYIGYDNGALTVGGSGSGAMTLRSEGTIRLSIGNSAKVIVDGSGNVGIGASPSAMLHVDSGSTSQISIFNSTGSSGTYGTYRTSGTDKGYFGYDNGGLTTGGSGSGAMTLRSEGTLRLAIGNAAKLTIDGSGNVGIGTTSPTNKLDVNGTVSATNVIAKFQDVAEWVPSSEQLSAGTVVVLDSTKSNQVTSSNVSYDTRVAGVVSGQPGIALGEKSEGKVLVATTGRVRVNVDATKSPIHIGDLLVTSDVAGVAMKSEPVNLGGVQIHRPGTLIGKALEPLERGKGSILVLLSLQ